jgi:hypothetical protein
MSVTVAIHAPSPYSTTCSTCLITPWIFIGDTPELEEQIAAALERFEPLPEGFAGQFYRFSQALQTGGELAAISLLVGCTAGLTRWNSKRSRV